MTEKNITAFPIYGFNHLGQPMPTHEGMELRDWFAGMALQALTQEYFRANGVCIGADHPYHNLPKHAYRMADAMMKARGE